jgi:hypothetical protein
MDMIEVSIIAGLIFLSGAACGMLIILLVISHEFRQQIESYWHEKEIENGCNYLPPERADIDEIRSIEVA